ncbi:TonB-dependent siderophore receptor [Pseudochelatococcus lubricantis]|uniref:TonB-dependent siderophore receptor n=1 Tax=Pseudochelatococcus lubricantis TaxID=1538102 RepID=UPI0035EF20F2
MNFKKTGGCGRRSISHYRNALLLGCAAIVTLTPSRLLAQEAETSDTAIVLDTITVGGTRADDDRRSIVATQTSSGSKLPAAILDTPASVSVITAKEMQQRGVQSVEDALKYTAGVTTDYYGSDNRFDFFKIRGFDAHMYRDGLTLGRPFGGVREEVYAFERIEVLKGANSTVFGVADPGGAVNFVTKRPKNERFGEAYLTGGSFNRKEVGLDFGDNITPDGKFSFRVTGMVRDADDEYKHSRDDQQFFMGGLTWRPSDATSLTVVYDYLNRDGVPGSGGHPVGSDLNRRLFFGEPDFNYRGTDRSTVSVMFDHDFGSGLSFSSNARYSDTKTDFGYAYISATPTNGSTLVNRAFFGNDYSSEHFIADARLQYDATFNNVKSRTLAGVEYNEFLSSTDTYWGAAPSINWLNPIFTGPPVSLPLISSTKNDQKTKSVYLQQELTIAEKLIATVGLRNDWLDLKSTNRLTGRLSDDDVSEFTKRIGVTYKWTDQLATYASYAESAAPPTIGLEPERGEQFELGIKYQPDAFPGLFSAAIYDLSKTNITVTNPATLIQSTIGEVRVRGIDLEAKAELMNNISLTAAYSYLDAEIVDDGNAGNKGNRPSFVPRHTASLWLNYLWKGSGIRGDMTFGVGGRYTGSYYFNEANTASTGSNFVVDAAVSYKVRESTSLELNVSNLFDRKHVAYGGFGADWYNPGRRISATLRHTW